MFVVAIVTSKPICQIRPVFEVIAHIHRFSNIYTDRRTIQFECTFTLKYEKKCLYG